MSVAAAVRRSVELRPRRNRLVDDPTGPRPASADQIDPQAKRAAARRSRIPLPHGRYRLKLLRLLTRPLTRLQNRNPPSVADDLAGALDA